jgi:hypothetical protein
MKPKNNCKARAGTALVEATLTLMLFLVLLFSLFDFGFVMYLHQSFVNQARAAARYGAANSADTTQIKNLVLYGQTTPTRTPFMGLQASNVTVTRSNPGTRADRINITISGYHYPLITPGLAGTYTGRPIHVSAPVEPD